MPFRRKQECLDGAEAPNFGFRGLFLSKYQSHRQLLTVLPESVMDEKVP